MAFLDKVKELAVSAAQTTNEKIEVAKISVDIKTEENRAHKVLEKIGEKVYEEYEKGVITDQEIVELCYQIDVIMERIVDLKEKSLNLRDKKTCISCGKELSEGDAFCSACGTKQPEKVKEDDPEKGTPKVEDSEVDTEIEADVKSANEEE